MRTMQPRYYEDRFPLGRFIFDRANALGLTRRELVERLGFPDRLAKGHQVLSEILLTGTVPPHLTTLGDALEVDGSVVDEVLYATARQQEAERQAKMLAREEAYREGFRPHLQVKTELSVPSPIFIAALLTTERLRIVHLAEEINSLVESKRNQIIREAIEKHYVDTSGRVPAFGRIEGYYFVGFAGFSGLDFGILFDLDGSPVGDMVAIRRVPEAGLGMKHRDTRLTGLLKNEPIQEILFGDIDVMDFDDSSC
jgi:hypothetical protein